MSRLILADIDTIIDIYWNKPVLSNSDIMRLFNCKNGSALKLKKQAKELMIKQGLLCYSEYAVDTKTAFEAWHIDIQDIEKRYSKKHRARR